MLKLRRSWRNLAHDTSSVAAIEFVLVLTPMLLILGGIYDLSELVIIRSELTNAALTMVASASNESVQADGSTALTYDQIQQAESSIWALVPSLRSGQHPGLVSVTMTSLLFYPNPYAQCLWGQTTPCKYLADIAWSEAYYGGDSGSVFAPNLPTTTACSSDYTTQSNQVAPGAPINGTDNLSIFPTLNIASSSATFSDTGTSETEAGVSPILVVNISYTYTPVINLYIIGPQTFWVDAYWPVRSVKNIAASQVNFGFGPITVEPLTNQFTTINNASLSGSDVKKPYYCVNGQVSGATS